MKTGDLVKHKLSGVGIIIGIEASESDYRVMFASGELFWVDPRLLEVINASR
jgi:hypothetical protein